MSGFKSSLLENALSKKGNLTALKMTSFSEEDMQQRIAAMDRSVHNFERMFRETGGAVNSGSDQISFAEGIGSANLRGTTFFDASITGLVTSILPYFTIERGMEHVSASLPYMDFYNIVKEEKKIVAPNLGLKTSMEEGIVALKSNAEDGPSFTINIGHKIVPGQLVIGAGDTRIVDNSRGRLMAEAGVLKEGKVNYSEGTVELTFGDGVLELANAKEVEVVCRIDYAAKEKLDAIEGEVKYYDAKAGQIVVPVKRNIITDDAIKKMGTLSPDQLYANAMVDQYHIRRNTLLAKNIVNGYRGTTLDVDLSDFTLKTSEYPAYVNVFINMLEAIDQNIANRLGVVKNATAYLVGAKGKYAFSTLSTSKDWVPNETATYVVGLFGWWKGRPVVYSDQLQDDECYASCKTTDGNLAPLISGSFLPMSNLPTVGNYDNVTKYATGIYSMESLDLLTSELLQRFRVKLPAALELRTVGNI